MAKSKKTSDAFDMAADIRKEVAAESVADACSTSVPAIYSLAKGDNPRRAKYDKNADVIGYNLRLPANIHRLLKRHCMETNESMNNVVLVALYRDMKNWEDLAPCPHCGATGPVIERIDNLFTDKLFTGAKTFTLFLGDLRLLPFFLFLQGGDLAIDVFDTLWHGTFLSFGYYRSLSSF